MIRILVDSTSDYTADQLAQKDLLYIPMHIHWDGTEYTDGITIQKAEFYDKLCECKEFPKTSQPSPQDFIEKFHKAKETNDELICILLSSSLSGTYQSACLAKQIIGYESIYIIDSCTATGGIQILVEEAKKMIKQGMSAKEIVKHLEELKTKICIYASVDTLEFLKRGGRISKAVASIGEIAKVKPLIHLNEKGEIIAISKSIGFKKVIQKICEYSENVDTNYPAYSLYTEGTGNLEKLESKLSEYQMKVERRVQIGPTIGAHVGPEAFGVVFVSK